MQLRKYLEEMLTLIKVKEKPQMVPVGKLDKYPNNLVYIHEHDKKLRRVTSAK